MQQIESKELQLQQLQFALSSYLNPDATLKLDGSITESLLSIRRSLSGGDYDDAADQTAQLKAAILKRSHTYSSGEEIEADIAEHEARWHIEQCAAEATPWEDAA